MPLPYSTLEMAGNMDSELLLKLISLGISLQTTCQQCCVDVYTFLDNLVETAVWLSTMSMPIKSWIIIKNY